MESGSGTADLTAAASEEVVVINADRPKVIEWEDLQQELARLWSLSSALKKAKERKEALSQRIESVIEVRTTYLRQFNELEEMRQKLEGQKLVMGDILLRTNKSMEDVRIRREQLCYQIRLLLAAAQTLSGQQQQLQEANLLLAGEGLGNLKNLQRMLRVRQQYMVTQVSALYPVKSPMVRTPGENHSRGDSSKLLSPDASKSSQPSSLTILGLQPTTLPLKKTGFFGDKKEAQRSATALGYVAHAVSLIASYLHVPLRYPLRLGGSRSYVQDHSPCVEPTASDLASNAINGTMSRLAEFPLFIEGQDTTRAAYAVFLLNKDLEQLLNFIGNESLGPRHVLPNLRELVRIVLSQDYVNSGAPLIHGMFKMYSCEDCGSEDHSFLFFVS